MIFPSGAQSPKRSELGARRRKLRSPAGAGFRLRRCGTPLGKSSALPTPLLKWKLHDGDRGLGLAGDGPPAAARCSSRRVGGGGAEGSVRKLAAELWHQPPQVLGAVGRRGAGGRRARRRPPDGLGFECGPGDVNTACPSYLQTGESCAEMHELVQNASPRCGPRNGILSKGPTRRDPGCWRTSDEVYRFHSHMKALEDQHVNTVSVVSALQAELVKARACIRELESEQHSSKKKIKQFLKKLHKENSAWQRREHQKVLVLIDDLKDELNRERQKCLRMQIVNSKLVNELADANLFVKQCLREYEKERKSRVLMEEVCNELAKEIAEDKAEVEALKRESQKIHDEVEEERKMLQLAEVWREERVQMKLVDAKLTLELKYNQMDKLIADLEAFLQSQSVTSDALELKNAELIQQTANVVNIHDLSEFSYVAPESYDIFSIVKELQSGHTNDKAAELCLSPNPSNSASKFCVASPEVDGLHESLLQKHSDGFLIDNSGLDGEASALETVTHAENQGSVFSSEGRGTEWDNVRQYSPQTESSEVCSISAKQLSKKAHWKLFPRSREFVEIDSVDANGSISNGNASDDCEESVHGIEKNTRKARLGEARMEARKFPLRHVLQQQT